MAQFQPVPPLAAPGLDGDRPIRILFIGNSYTHVNDLPALLTALAGSAGRQIVTDHQSPGGCTLEQHFKDGLAAAKILGQAWDYVVLQEQSLRPLQAPALMSEYARKLHELAAGRGAKTILYQTWARRDTPETQEGLSRQYAAVAQQLGAVVAPAGDAWKRWREAEPERCLHVEDGSHPNPMGSYLAACVFYATLFGSSPEGLPGALRAGDNELVSFDAETACALQTVAWTAVTNAKRR